MLSDLQRAAIAVAIPQLSGMTSAYVSNVAGGDNKLYYRSLAKPWYSPPPKTFGIVWPCLYAGMGYASYLVHRDGGGFDGIARHSLTVYGATIVIGWAFSPINFVYKKRGLATIICGTLAGMYAYLAYKFHEINPTAGHLIMPTALWCAFATLISQQMWALNKDEKIE